MTKPAEVGTAITPVAPAPPAPVGPPPPRPSAPAWNGMKFNVQLGSVGDPGAAIGFNAPEASWQVASESPAYVLLPFKVSGRVHVKIDGWVAATAVATPVKVSIGAGGAAVAFSARNEAHEFDIDAGAEGADRLGLESVISPPSNADARKLGVGVVAIEISRAN